MKLEKRTKEFLDQIKGGGHSIRELSEQEKDLETEKNELNMALKGAKQAIE